MKEDHTRLVLVCPGHACRGFLLANVTVQDETYMDLAFDLAERGRGLTHPNPRVGSVIVRAGEIVGQGYHRGPGTPHAEAQALAQAGERARDATLYCTLEPCAHEGRTPPCADAVVAAGVARVVAALQDPNPLVDGRGFARLRQGGLRVDVMTGAPARRAGRLNAPFIKALRSGLPLVTYKAAVSLDGKVALDDGRPAQFSGPESRRLVHQMRAHADAVLIGAGTLRTDDPQLTVRLCKGRDPLRVVITASGKLPGDSRLFASAEGTPTLVLAEQMTVEDERRLASDGVQVERFAGGLDGALGLLAGRGVLDVLLEGGPTLAAALLARGLIDRVAVFVTPLMVGRGAPDLLALPAVTGLSSAPRLANPVWRAVGQDMLLEADIEVA
jgi:diaminohydroxyphosphoribosylaminopyrimidine deaminase / 5-amino-6-(5-phosphoribosylamino)uracil reductase